MICQNYGGDMPKIFPIYTQDILNISPRYPGYWICPICAHDMFKDTLAFQGGGLGWAGLGLGCEFELPE